MNDSAARCSFSILERIDVGETFWNGHATLPALPFSILERIDVGETQLLPGLTRGCELLSVSSNGSTWVKRFQARLVTARTGLSVSSNGSTWVKLHLAGNL